MGVTEERAGSEPVAGVGLVPNETASIVEATESRDRLVLRLVELMTGIRDQLDQVERRVGPGVVKEMYTTEEAAERLGRSEWTVRQWCNKGQVRAWKVRGRGRVGEWRIRHDELVRVQHEGPLPAGTVVRPTVA